MARRRPTEPTANPARGAALVVVAVLIGLFLLRNGLDTSDTVESPGDTSSDSGDTTDGTVATDQGDDGTETTEPLRTPAQVPLIVLNGTNTSGAAGKWSTALAAAGYQLTDANGADATADVAATQVLYNPGFEREAAVVASAIGATGGTAPMGTTEPGTIAGAQVVVVIGPDLASATPPSIPAT
jgi:hypothetical protein